MVESKSQYNDYLHAMLQCLFLNKQEYTLISPQYKY